MTRLAGKYFAYILGVYLGDGGVSYNQGYPAFRLNTIDSEFADAVITALSSLTDRTVRVGKHDAKKSRNPNYHLWCSDPVICKKLVTDTKEKIYIPKFVLKMTTEEKRAFISGLMDSKGYVGKVNRSDGTQTNRDYYIGFKSYDPWVMDFIRVLESVGVQVGKIGREKPRRSGYKSPIRFTIKMQSWIDSGCYFNIRRKQNRVDLWKSADAYTQRSRHPRGGPIRYCKLPGCKNRHLARGYCSSHYNRIWRRGKRA